MIDEALVHRAEAALMPTYRRQPVAFARGEGAYLWDTAGRRYVDCMAGISMINVGHAHPAVTAAISRQAEMLVNCSNLYYTEPQIELAEWIRDRSIGGKVFFCNSGAEANEAALKLARRRGGQGRPEVVALIDGFHGRTYGALSLTGQPAKQVPFAPLVPGVVHVERNDHEGLAAAVSDRTCAIFLETIQGEVGVYPMEPEFLLLARDLATRHGALLVVDEIQTGLSRTGPLWSYQELGFEPDVMSVAKSLGAGVPIGAIVARPEFADTLQPGDHGSTFAGGPLACAAALAACGVLDDPALQDHVRRVGGVLLDGLRTFVADGLASEARGKGLMCGLDLTTGNAADVVAELLAAGYLANNTSPRTLRFLPPLVISEEDVTGLLAALRRAIIALR